jgi:hypothetical protein
VAAPGIVQSFDAGKQTVQVSVAVREKISIDGVLEDVEIPLLLDVPILMPRAGGFSLTLPVQAGDECLVVFGDSCMDAWWQSGGVQDQIDRRRHDLSDGFAILGPWSQPRTISGYSTNSAVLRNSDGSVKVEVKSGEVDVTAPVVNIGGGSLQALIDARFAAFFDAHTHSSSGAGPPNSPMTPVLLTLSTVKTKAS